MDDIEKALEILDKKVVKQDEVIFESDLRNKIVNSDCISFMEKMPDECIDLCITDPPYGVSVFKLRDDDKSGEIANDGIRDYFELMDEFPKSLYRVMKKKSTCYIFCGGLRPVIPKLKSDNIFWTPSDMMIRFWKAGFRPVRFIIWDKMSVGIGAKYRYQCELILVLEKGTAEWIGEGDIKSEYFQMDNEGVIHIKRIHGGKKVHIAEKPSSLYESFILNSSKAGDLIFDPFAGSGTIVEAAKNTARNYLAIELEEKNIELIRNREKQLTIEELVFKKTEMSQLEFDDNEESD